MLAQCFDGRLGQDVKNTYSQGTDNRPELRL